MQRRTFDGNGQFIVGGKRTVVRRELEPKSSNPGQAGGGLKLIRRGKSYAPRTADLTPRERQRSRRIRKTIVRRRAGEVDDDRKGRRLN